MAGELFKLSSGISMTHVPYRGAALAITDVMAGHVDLMFADMGSAASLVKAGKVRAIGISVDQRAAAFPEPPPISQTGLPGFDAKLWIGVCVRAGTPPDIVHHPFEWVVVRSTATPIVVNLPDDFWS